jgi:mannose-6-phosphate isomerase
MSQLPPFKLQRKLDTRIWGGNSLGNWLGLASVPDQLAESWQVYDDNRVSGGRFNERSLAELVTEFGADLVGTRTFERYGADFPLLAKFIDAADDLSVQVHPNDEYAHTVEAHTGFHGKTEAWYILRAEPGAHLIHGLVQESSREQFSQAVEQGNLSNILRKVAVKPGDTVFVPAGLVHAISGGIMLFEIQQKSDLTYRVYDYDRRDAQGNLRELHLERALDVIDYRQGQDPYPQAQVLDEQRTLLVQCTYFAMEHWTLNKTYATSTDPSSFQILTTIVGDARLEAAGHQYELKQGESIVLPASLGAYQVSPSEKAELLVCYVPEI